VTCPLWPYRPISGITKGRKNGRKNSARNSQTQGQDADLSSKGGQSSTGQYRAAKEEAAVLKCRIARLTVEQIEGRQNENT